MALLISLVLAVIIARIGRFVAARHHHDDDAFFECGHVGWTGGTGDICTRLRGHWGSHRTSPEGWLGWYCEWEDKSKVRVVGFFGETFEKEDRGRGV